MYSSVLQPLDNNPTTFVVVWNFDAFVPTRKLNSDLLDVVLYTDPELGNVIVYVPVYPLCSLADVNMIADNSPRISGHAVLPLAPTSECCAQSQHVVLVDCHFGLSNSSISMADGVRSRLSPGKSGQTNVKFMLTLKVSPFGVSFPRKPY
ncbi:unnamed protein product [Echinostoma caproni]|uniref:Endo/exonuclease/phosphatase domain-containing protein n=1 Tax=Echinostoma caproni TaxID=27848 RepID=A0A183AHZ6_9TREM|nr:unnamed protein product [Echinostoma caproni]